MSDNITTKELILKMEKDLKEDIAKVEAQLEKLWEAIDKLKNRPPVWVTFIISILMALIGYLANN